MSPEASAVVIVIASLLGCLLSIPNLLVQLHAQNRAVSTLVLSVLFYNILRLINALIWQSADVRTWWDGRGFCDIEIKLQGGLEMLISGSPACIFYQLNTILDMSRSIIGLSRNQRRSILTVEIILLGVFPFLRMVLSYSVQPRRYGILGVLGCSQPLDPSWPTYILWLLWPLAVCLIGAVFAARTTYQLHRHRRETANVLMTGQTSASKSRNRRMFVLAWVLLMVITPYMIYYAYSQRPLGLKSYSWSRVHPPNWSELIDMIPFRFNPRLFLSALWQVFMSMLIFACFGWGHDARDVYRLWTQRLKRLFSKICTTNEITTRTPTRSNTANFDLRQHPRDFACELESMP